MLEYSAIKGDFMKRWQFDEKFMIKKIKEGKERLKYINSDSEEAYSIFCMIEEFEKFLGIASEDIDFYVEPEQAFSNMSDVLNKDLTLIGIKELEKLEESTKRIPKIFLDDTNNIVFSDDNDCIINTALDFYESLDLKIYDTCRRILSSDYHLINFASKNNIRKERNGTYCFICEYLKLPFINISLEGNLKYMATVHELRHATNYLLYGKLQTLIGELPSVYSELIFIDKMNEKYKCSNLYNFRINDISKKIINLRRYMHILKRFNEHGRVLDRSNFLEILSPKNQEDFLDLYKNIINRVFVINYGYLLSTLIALDCRMETYKGNIAQVSKKLDNMMLGEKYQFDYDELVEKYREHVGYAYTLSKK